MEETRRRTVGQILLDAGVEPGTRLYSPAYGEVIFDKVDDTDYAKKITPMIHTHSVVSRLKKTFFMDGSISTNGECILFPSKENRDWNTFEYKQRFPSTFNFERTEYPEVFDLKIKNTAKYLQSVQLREFLPLLLSLRDVYNEISAKNCIDSDQRYGIFIKSDGVLEIEQIYNNNVNTPFVFIKKHAAEKFVQNFGQEIRHVLKELYNI